MSRTCRGVTRTCRGVTRTGRERDENGTRTGRERDENGTRRQRCGPEDARISRSGFSLTIPARQCRRKRLFHNQAHIPISTETFLFPRGGSVIAADFRLPFPPPSDLRPPPCSLPFEFRASNFGFRPQVRFVYSSRAFMPQGLREQLRRVPVRLRCLCFLPCRAAFLPQKPVPWEHRFVPRADSNVGDGD